MEKVISRETAVIPGNNAAFKGNGNLGLLEKLENQGKTGRDRKIKVENKKLEAIGGCFKKMLEREDYSSSFDPQGIYDAVAAGKLKHYTARDLEAFSALLVNYEQMRGFGRAAGYFLSALIEGCREKDFSLRIENLSAGIDNIGNGNTKNITIYGNAGECTGAGMRKGRIVIKGNAGDSTGFGMENGRIDVEGDAGRSTGYGMTGGKINVRGNTGEQAGLMMTSGKINILGNAGRWTGARMRGGFVHIFGSCGEELGTGMEGGEIIVEGDVGQKAGIKMKGGTLKINGWIAPTFAVEDGGNVFQKGRQLLKDGKVVLNL